MSLESIPYHVTYKKGKENEKVYNYIVHSTIRSLLWADLTDQELSGHN